MTGETEPVPSQTSVSPQPSCQPTNANHHFSQDPRHPQCDKALGPGAEWKLIRRAIRLYSQMGCIQLVR